MEKPVIAPPKAKNFQEKKKIFNERNNIILPNIDNSAYVYEMPEE